jgi:hypothetical protein
MKDHWKQGVDEICVCKSNEVQDTRENCLMKGFYDVRFQVFMVVTMKNAVFWGVMLCGSECDNREFKTFVSLPVRECLQDWLKCNDTEVVLRETLRLHGCTYPYLGTDMRRLTTVGTNGGLT